MSITLQLRGWCFDHLKALLTYQWAVVSYRGPNTMHHRCRAHLATRWYAYAKAQVSYFRNHMHTIFLLSNHDLIVLPNNIHKKAQHVLSELADASDKGGSALIETIHRLETCLDVNNLINNLVNPYSPWSHLFIVPAQPDWNSPWYDGWWDWQSGSPRPCWLSAERYIL